MRAPETFIGHQVRDLVEMHNTNHPHGFRIFRLQGPKDTVGLQIVEDATIRGALDRVPSLTFTWIVSAEDYYGQYILRVSSKRR